MSIMSSIENLDFIFDFKEIKDLKEINLEDQKSLLEIEYDFLSTKSSNQENTKELIFFSKQDPSEHILKIIKKDDSYSFIPLVNTNLHLKQHLWIVLRKHFFDISKCCELQANDIFRLGKYFFRIREINLKKEEKIAQKNFLNKQNVENDKICCRICLNEESTPGNPLINPCACKGSMKYIHFLCTQKWLNEKYVTCTKSDKLTIYCWKNSLCELCKQPLDLVHDVNLKPKHLMSFLPTTKNTILLESIYPDEKKKNYLIYMHMKSNQDIIIGRESACDMTINDISISKQHAKIFLSNNKVFIKDMNSRCGTLILFKGGNYPKSSQLNLCLQIKSNVFLINNIN